MSQPSAGHALIIEDELVLGLGMQSVLAELGFSSFAFASTAAQALEQAQLRKPDLITADVGLMHGTGPEAAASIISACGPVPVIYVTGDPQALSRLDGAVVVAKPFAPSEIAQACQRLWSDPAEAT